MVNKILKLETNMKYFLYIFYSYLVFLSILFLFGKGFNALTSFLITSFACLSAIYFIIYKLRNVLFNQIDFFWIGLIFCIQTIIGAFHFDSIINQNYFIENRTSVDLYSTYYYDIIYFAFLVDLIAEDRLLNGYLFINPGSVAFHKNYFLAYLVSDIFILGDAYVLNYTAINVLSIFYSGIIISLIHKNLFKDSNTSMQRKLFYLTIMQPIAWIPSHTMRDVLGAFVIILSIGLIYSSINRIQKIFFLFLGVFLVMQHRLAYVFSSFVGFLYLNLRGTKTLSFSTFFSIFLLILFLVFILNSTFYDLFSSNLTGLYLNSNLVDFNFYDFIFKFIVLIIGPFPWTQYFDGSSTGYVSFYFSTLILQAAFQLTIFYFLFINIKKIFSKKELRDYFFIILLFAIPAFFSQGGHNLYLLPSSMLGICFLHFVSVKRFITVFIGALSIYITLSSLFFFLT